MATFRKQPSGSWRAEVYIKGRRASRTFSTKSAARTWAVATEREFEAAEVHDGLESVEGLAVADLIDRYVRELKPAKPWGRSKDFSLQMLRRELGAKAADALSWRDLETYAKKRSKGGAGPVTVGAEIAYLRKILEDARLVWRMDVSLAPVIEAWPSLRRQGLVGKSRQRTRRPTPQELARIIAHFEEVSERSVIPMAEIVRFALACGMRQGEICRIAWADLNVDERAVLVRDRKDPQHKVGNHQWAPLLGEAWEIVQRQPRVADKIFPHCERSVSAAWTRACKRLGIVDLRFHDLRHECLSRLAELGWSEVQLRAVSGHRDIRMLSRYARPSLASLHGLPQPGAAPKPSTGVVDLDARRRQS